MPPKPIKLYLIRHGEVEKKGYCNGHRDVALTGKGVAQMRRVARLLKDVPIKGIYSSDLQRARIGAAFISKYHDVKVRIYAELREKQFGHWEGMRLETIKRRFKGEWEDWIKRPDRACPLGGESYDQVMRRVFEVVRQILRDYSRGPVVIVSHGGVNRVILSRVLGLDLRFLNRIRQDYAAINIVEWNGREGEVWLLNGHSIPKIHDDGI